MKENLVGYGRGFTVIEVMLFLAITGLMMFGLFLGISSAIGRQQYEDTVSSLVDFTQGQYNLVSNVRSNRDAAALCTASGFSVGTGPASDMGRGTSDCTIIGRLITSSDGKQITSRPVFATKDITTINQSGVDEQSIIKEMNLLVANNDNIVGDVETYSVPWSGRVYVNGVSNPPASVFSLLIIKMPGSGMTRTYSVPSLVTGHNASPTHSDNLWNMVSRALASNAPLRLCVVPADFGSPATGGVRVLPMAGNVTGVQRIAASETTDAC